MFFKEESPLKTKENPSFIKTWSHISTYSQNQSPNKHHGLDHGYHLTDFIILTDLWLISTVKATPLF